MNGGHVFGVERLKSPLDRAPAVHRALLGVSQREFHGGHALTGFSIDSDKRRAQLLISLPDESVAGIRAETHRVVRNPTPCCE
jgi:hypothetical protein